MSWLIFMPLTLLRILKHPVKMMRYAEEQLELPPEEQFIETLSPPIMLVMTALASQAIALAVEGSNSIVSSNRGLARLVSDNTTLLILRIFLFAVFALVMAGRKVQCSSVNLDRRSLKPAFYAQCYATAPFALLIAVASVGLNFQTLYVRLISAAAFVVAIVDYGAVETLWFRRELGLTFPTAFLQATLGFFVSALCFVLVGLLFIH